MPARAGMVSARREDDDKGASHRQPRELPEDPCAWAPTETAHQRELSCR